MIDDARWENACGTAYICGCEQPSEHLRRNAELFCCWWDRVQWCWYQWCNGELKREDIEEADRYALPRHTIRGYRKILG